MTDPLAAPDTAEEAMRRALLYVFQAKRMTPMTALAVIRALAQDGYGVTLAAPAEGHVHKTSDVLGGCECDQPPAPAHCGLAKSLEKENE